jgi:hypothetical protein
MAEFSHRNKEKLEDNDSSSSSFLNKEEIDENQKHDILFTDRRENLLTLRKKLNFKFLLKNIEL